MESLSPERWQRVRVLFDEVLDRPPEERSAFLAAAVEDAALRAEVEALLEAERAAGSLLEAPVEAYAGGLVGALLHEQQSAPAVTAGQQIGSYRVLHEIGRGGMSVVCLAERADGQFDQRVALKLIKRGMDSDLVVQRFLQERQILARLQHPCIARLYDGGMTEDGQPFFAMEYVEGEPVDAYCDRRRLSIEARLRLVVQIAEAVHYAHRNLVVHRDLKPSNILVADGSEGAPVVKLLDFGIARLLTDDPEAAVLTQTGMRVLTPAYAAPEQVAGEPVTTATDSYALGLILYELLSGRRPFAHAGATGGAAVPAFETAPLRPSAAVRHAAAQRPGEGPAQAGTPEAIASTRGLTVERLRRRLAGDLDTICLAALRAEPERRYASAEAFGADIRRHLDGLPVAARPDTLAYRARKFIGRHRVSVVAALLVTAAVVVGLAAALWQAGVARQERDQKRVEAARANVTLDYVLDLFADLDPLQAQGRRFTGHDLIGPGLRRLSDFKAQPLEYAAVAHRLGQLSAALGQFHVAESLYAEARALQEVHLPPDAPDLAATLEGQAKVFQLQARYAEAEPLLEQALAIRRRHFSGAQDPALLKTLNQLAHVRLALDKLAEAEAGYREALALAEAATGTLQTEGPRSRRGLAEVYVEANDLARAIPLFEAALDGYRTLLGPSHSEVGRTLFGLAQAWQQQGDFVRADSLYHLALEAYRRVYGVDHHQAGIILSNLGNTWRDAGDLPRAERYYQEAVMTYDRAVPGPYLLKAFALEKLGTVQMNRGKLEEAEPSLRRAAEMVHALGDIDPINLPRMRLVLAGCIARLGRHGEAYALLLQNYQATANLGLEGEALALRQQTLKGLAHLAAALGKAEEAARYGAELERLSTRAE